MREREWNLDDRLAALYDDSDSSLSEWEYNTSINELSKEYYDVFRNELSMINERFNNDPIEYKAELFKRLIPIIKKVKEDNNILFFNEVVTYLLNLNDLYGHINHIKFTNYLKAFYYPGEFSEYLYYDLAKTIRGSKDIDDKVYNHPLINLLNTFNSFCIYYDSKNINPNSIDTFSFGRTISDCIEYIHLHKMYDIDIGGLLLYICDNVKKIDDYYWLNTKMLPLVRNINGNIGLRKNLAIKIIEDFKMSHKGKREIK